MCSVSNNDTQSPIVQTPTETISYKVKRRLFQDEEEKKINTSLLSATTSTITTTTLKTDDTAIVNNESTLTLLKGANSDAVLTIKSIVNQILIITTFEESANMQLLSDQAMCLINNVNVLHCLPEHAFRQCEQSKYNIIFTDIDLQKNCEILRLILSIRKKSQLNNYTPVIALRQTIEKNVDAFSFYGISNVFRGEVDVDQIKNIFQMYKHVFSSPPEVNDVVIPADPTSVKIGEPALQQTSIQQTTSCTDLSTTIEPPVFVLTKPTENLDTNESVGATIPLTSSSAHQIITKTETKDSPSQQQPVMESIPVPAVPKNSGIFINPFIPANFTLRPMNKAIFQRPRALHNKINVNALPPPFTFHPRRFPFNLANQIPPAAPPVLPVSTPASISAETPYMVSGAPGSSDMKITLIPDEALKHSTKERVRREKIKDCVDKLRNLLPRPLGCTRKLDMATVLEMTVKYLKIIQAHATPLTNEQCSQIFQNSYQQSINNKRSSQNDDRDASSSSMGAKPAKVAKLTKKNHAEKHSSTSPKRGSVVFQPPSNMCHHYRTIGNPSMATMATIFPPPTHDGMLQTPFPQQLGNHAGPMAVPGSHGRTVMPYQGVEYFNMLFPPNAYENLTHNPMVSQQARNAPTIKEPLFSDATLPLPTDFSQQHLAFYNHH